ncbi:restriction endonuclease subunit S [Pseudoalteromonas sp. DY56-GL22]|uniref:restriction endonuclease subunit S n=1 Tax=Pseudoalteromonas sp. DY56-GL22 TaxID=2967126 RepID=UPI00352B8C39
MTDINKLITDNIDVWSSAQLNANSSGRGANKKRNLIGIKKLRELILELAFSGKLVNSDEREDFEQTLNEINKQKIEFHSEKGVRVQAFKKLADEPSNLLVPNNWKVCYLDQVVNYITDFQANGSFATIKKNVTYFDSPNYALLVRLTDLRHKLTDDSSYKYTDEHGYNFLSKSSVHGGELVVANVGAGVGTTLLVPKIDMPATLAPNMFMIVLPELVDKEYFLYFSQSPQYWRHINKVNTGTGQPKINKTEYKNCKFPLAPRKIQKLVVSKVKELMALCDQLEQQTEASIDAHQLLVEELLSALTNSDNSQEFEQNWMRITEHFDLLFTTEHSIEQLKQTILQLAIMGKLVPQDPNDEPASELLKRIAQEKEQLIKDKVIKKAKKLPDISNEEIEFQIPQSWSVTRLGDVTNYGSCDKAELTDVDESCWVLELEDVEKVTSKLIKKVRVSERQFKSSKNRFNSGDVIYGKLRPYLDKVLVADENGVCTTEMIPIRSYYGINSEYLRIVMKTPYFIEYANNSTHGMNLPRMGTDKARLAPIIVAPVNEQALIVSKVNQLISICEELKTAIKITEEVNVELAEAVVMNALS